MKICPTDRKAEIAYTNKYLNEVISNIRSFWNAERKDMTEEDKLRIEEILDYKIKLIIQEYRESEKKLRKRLRRDYEKRLKARSRD